jgi:cell division protein FtsB
MFKNPKFKWILLPLILLAFFLSSEGSRSYWKRKRALKNLEQRLSNLKSSNEDLSRQITRLKTDPRALERIARNELGLIKPDEVEYRFVVNRSSK